MNITLIPLIIFLLILDSFLFLLFFFKLFFYFILFLFLLFFILFLFLLLFSSFISPINWYFNIIYYHYIFNSLSIIIFQLFIMFKSIFWNPTINSLNHCYCKSITILFTWINIFTCYFFIIYSLLEPWFIHLLIFFINPIIWYWKFIIF